MATATDARDGNQGGTRDEVKVFDPAVRGVSHPLDPLTRDEIAAAAGVVRREMRELGENLRFETVELCEPDKTDVRAYDAGSPIPRKARVNVYRAGGIGVWRLVVALDSLEVVSKSHVPDARAMIQLEEFLQIEDAVKRDPRFVEACARRGITDMDLVCVDPWSAGNFGVAGEEDKRLSHGFCWLKSSEFDNQFAHPIQGLNPVVDIATMQVLRVDDYGVTPVPGADRNYAAEFQARARSDLRPIEIEQPDGVSFRMEGSRLDWHEWSVRLGFNAREGLTLHDFRYAGRPVCYRASIAEMVVPYGSPDPAHARKNVFDIGEYGVGKLTNSLALGCDCLGAIRYLDCWMSDIDGEPMCVENGICIHEEDSGILWKHWDFRTDKTEVRRGRRLVVSSICTVGNYEYGSYWYLYLDGRIEFEMKATGIINTVGCEPGAPQRYGVEVAPGIVGQIHQHLFCARLDMSVDGDRNSVLECNTHAEPPGPENPYGNAFYAEETPLTRECGRTRNPDTQRYWRFVNPNRRNAMGAPTGYKLEPSHATAVFVNPDSPSGKRMAFVRNHLWITACDPEERYPGGEFMNHSDGSDGVHAYAAKGRPVENADVVAWHVFGIHHLPRPEDFPVQPVVSTGFELVPSGFFDANPTLDLPRARSAKSCRA